MKLALGADTVKRSLSAHAAIGLIGGALLYLLCLSGTVLVLYEEWQRFEQQDAPEMDGISPAAVQRGIAEVLATEAGMTPTTHLYVHLPVEALPRTTITTDHQAFHLTEDGAIAMPEENHWSEFLYGLHYAFNLPVLVGMTIVGALGALMVALAISGVIALPRIFRDAFRLRAKQSGGIALADWHNRLSVWTLPFTLAIAITGAVIGLATVTAYPMAQGEYGGDIEAVYAPIFGEEHPADPAPAPIPNVAAAIEHMTAGYPGVETSFAIVHDPGTAGQHVQMIGTHGQRLIFGEYYHFKPDGTFESTGGLADGEIGKQAAASVYSLHFGDYGGLPVKIAYIVFGLGLTVVCATGVYIWLGKRRRRGFSEPRLLGAWHGVVWGGAAALASTLLARFVIGNEAPFAAIFWILFAAAIVAGVFVPRRAAMPQPPEQPAE
jgi:uncharacterized iron-regulated membrane protein